MYKKLCAVIDTAESDYAVSLIPRSQASQWHWQHWIRLSSVIDTPKSSFSITLTTLNQTPQCHWYPGVKLRNDIDNAESDSAVALIPRSQASQWHWQRKSNMLYLVFFSNLKRHHIILYTFYVSTVTQLDPIFKGKKILSRGSRFWRYFMQFLNFKNHTDSVESNSAIAFKGIIRNKKLYSMVEHTYTGTKKNKF